MSIIGNPITLGGAAAPSNPVAQENDVIFIDYDGTIRYSYSAADFANLSALPANPSHDGLTAQGWNWTLANAKTYVAENGMIEIGQNYVTDNGRLRIYVTIDEYHKDPYLIFRLSNGVSATIYWGDGQNSTVVGEGIRVDAPVSPYVGEQHHYTNGGDYLIEVETEGIIVIRTDSNSLNAYLISGNPPSSPSSSEDWAGTVFRIELCSNIVLQPYAFTNMVNLLTITVPSDTDIDGYGTFKSCSSLKSVTAPKNTAIRRSYGSICSETKSMMYFSFSENGGNIIYGADFQNSSLRRLSLPTDVTRFYNDTFRSCSCLCRVCVSGAVTKMARYTFYSSIIRSIKLPSELTEIGDHSFGSCKILSEIEIPPSVASIAASAFGGCTGLKKISFKPTTPPTVANSNAWTSLPTDCTIYVPYSADHSVLNAYKAKTNYPDPNTYTYVEVSP